MKILTIGLIAGLMAAGSIVGASSQTAHASLAIRPVVAQSPGHSGSDRDYNFSRNDQTLTNEVYTALVNSQDVNAAGIRVTSRNGNVYLSGTVGSQEEKRMAQEIADSIDGVNQVYADNLRVSTAQAQQGPNYSYENRRYGSENQYRYQQQSPNGSRGYYNDRARNYSSNDERLESEVYRSLRSSLGPDASRIGVDVDNGNVYLSGTVSSRDEKRMAWQAADSVDGVNRVFTNDLRVSMGQRESESGYPPGYYPFEPRR